MTNESDSSFADILYEINYDILPSQTNIYGVSCFKKTKEGPSKVLIGLIEGRIFVLEYDKQSRVGTPKCSCREVSFTYIPGKCHIISVDSFSCAARGLIVGITFCKEATENFLNIYCNYGDDVPTDQQWNLDHVAQNCRMFELKFTPYHLTHCKVKSPVTDENQTVFILLGSDGLFRVYAQEKTKGEFQLTTEPASSYFVELKNDCDIPSYLEIKNLEDNNVLKRFTAIGHTFGKITAFLVDIRTNVIMSSWSIEHNSPIVQCQLFTSFNVAHLVIVSARELSVVYQNILKEGFSSPIVLNDSNKYDCVTSCAVADIDYDGHEEILIGTFGNKILAYSFDLCSTEVLHSLRMKCLHEFNAPVLKIKFLDFTGDGIDEMVVVTTNGAHLMQSNLQMVLNKCKTKLRL